MPASSWSRRRATSGLDEPQYPAAEAIAVTATDLTGARAPFANHGSWVDVAAPGDDIVSAIPVDGYAEWDGTSMAAPMVAGQAALIVAERPLPPDTIEDLIRSTAVPLDDGSGTGRIDVAASLRALPHVELDDDDDDDD